MFGATARVCAACAVFTVPVVFTYPPATTAGHVTTIVVRQDTPSASHSLGYVPFEPADGPEMPHLPDGDFVTHSEIATNMATAVRLRVIGPESSD